MTYNVHTKIDGIALPTPAQCETVEYDIDTANTGRPEDGYLHRERKRERLMAVTYTWRNLTEAQAALIRSAIEPPQFLLERRFLGETTQRTMYAGDRKWTEYYDSSGECHVDLQVQFSEY